MTRRRAFLVPLSLSLACTLAHGDPWTPSATLEAARSAVTYAQLAGFVRDVRVDVAHPVATGDILALLEDQALRLQAESAGLVRQQSERRLSRARQLRAKGGVSAQQLEELEAAARTAHIRWQQARLDLSRAALTAPMDGVVAEVHLAPGMATTARLPAFRIIDPTDLRAELFVPADQLHRVRVGQQVRATAPALPQQPIVGCVARISPLIDPASGRCPVSVLFPGAGRVLKPGAVVQIELQQTEAPSCGRAALKEEEDTE